MKPHASIIDPRTEMLPADRVSVAEDRSANANRQSGAWANSPRQLAQRGLISSIFGSAAALPSTQGQDERSKSIRDLPASRAVQRIEIEELPDDYDTGDEYVAKPTKIEGPDGEVLCVAYTDLESKGKKIGMPIPHDNGGSIVIHENATIYNAEGQKALPQAIAISYLNPNVGGAHWLQFVWSEIECTPPNEKPYVLEGSLPVSLTGMTELTTDRGNPIWTLDAIRENGPFYDSSGGAHITSQEELTLVDRPELTRVPHENKPDGFRWTVSNMFSSYLVRNGSVRAVVPWKSVQKIIKVGGKPKFFAPIHTAGTPAVIDRLPEELEVVLAFVDSDLTEVLHRK